MEVKLHLEKIYSSSDKLDEQLQQQKPKGDMISIGYYDGESSKEVQERPMQDPI